MARHDISLAGGCVREGIMLPKYLMAERVRGWSTAGTDEDLRIGHLRSLGVEESLRSNGGMVMALMWPPLESGQQELAVSHLRP